VASGAKGCIFVADSRNNRIRCITPQGFVVTVAGTGVSGTRDGPSLEASFDRPFGIALDKEGNVVVTDSRSVSFT